MFDRASILSITPILSSGDGSSRGATPPPSVNVQLSVAIMLALAASAAEPRVYVLPPPSKSILSVSSIAFQPTRSAS